MKICVFAASSERLDAVYLEAARQLGRQLGLGGHTLVYGCGATGLMGACARGVAEAGGEIVGVAPRFFDEPGILYEGCSRFVFTETMAERKSAMEELAEGFLVLPGGIGTLEEFFEVLTLRQLGRHDKPIVLLNTAGYFDALDAMLAQAADKGFMSREVLRLYALCRTGEEALASLLCAPESGAKRSLRSYT